MNPAIALIPFLLPDPLCIGPCIYEEPPVISNWGFIGNHWIFTTEPGWTPIGTHHCPGSDMIEIQGRMVTSYGLYNIENVEALQNQTCVKWDSKQFPERCAEFSKDRWEKVRTKLPRKDMHYCIDPYEWPNREGAAPWILVTLDEAQEQCQSKGKRLCTEEEWTFACEGEEALPYPYGYVRDSQKCNIDRDWIQYNEKVMMPRGTVKCGEEMARLWQGHTSGYDSQCVSPFGVHDMTGNVDEWTTATRPGKFSSILKGGYWARVRNRCRSSTRSHGPDHSFYQQGFRCCANVKI